VTDGPPWTGAGMLTGLSEGSLVAHYRVIRPLGHGGMAVVYKAVDERLGREVALKVMAPALAGDEQFRQRFIRESRAAAAINDPHILPVFEANEDRGLLYIAMRLIQGGDAQALLREHGRLPPPRVAGIISPIAAALDAAHKAGLIHRDVKPANLLVDRSAGRPDHVYLADFGLSKSVLSSGPTGLGSNSALGTLGYSAPEQLEGSGVTGRADQYSLACTAYALLTGETPFAANELRSMLWAQMWEPPAAISSRGLGIAPATDDVFRQALAVGPENRYVDCSAFADSLRSALGLPAYLAKPGHDERRSHPRPAARTPTERVRAPTSDPSTVTAGSTTSRRRRRPVPPVPSHAPPPGVEDNLANSGLATNRGDSTDSDSAREARVDAISPSVAGGPVRAGRPVAGQPVGPGWAAKPYSPSKTSATRSVALAVKIAGSIVVVATVAVLAAFLVVHGREQAAAQHAQQQMVCKHIFTPANFADVLKERRPAETPVYGVCTYMYYNQNQAYTTLVVTLECGPSAQKDWDSFQSGSRPFDSAVKSAREQYHPLSGAWQVWGAVLTNQHQFVEVSLYSQIFGASLSKTAAVLRTAYQAESKKSLCPAG
jgi:serine/threonine protein kinase